MEHDIRGRDKRVTIKGSLKKLDQILYIRQANVKILEVVLQATSSSPKFSADHFLFLNGTTKLNTLQTQEEEDPQKAKSKTTGQRKIPEKTK